MGLGEQGEEKEEDLASRVYFKACLASLHVPVRTSNFEVEWRMGILAIHYCMLIASHRPSAKT